MSKKVLKFSLLNFVGISSFLPLINWKIIKYSLIYFSLMVCLLYMVVAVDNTSMY